MREVRLGVGNGGAGSGHAALVDDWQFESVTRYSWHVKTGRSGIVYAERSWLESGKGSTQHHQMMHQLVTGTTGVDHQDGNELNNQEYNLRVTGQAQNSQNRAGSVGASRFKGVSWEAESGKWRARVKLNGRRHSLGRFASEEEAARAYDRAARGLFGAFAHLNFPAEELP